MLEVPVVNSTNYRKLWVDVRVISGRPKPDRLNLDNSDSESTGETTETYEYRSESPKGPGEKKFRLVFMAYEKRPDREGNLINVSQLAQRFA